MGTIENDAWCVIGIKRVENRLEQAK